MTGTSCCYIPRRYIWALLSHIGVFLVYVSQVNINYAMKHMAKNCTNDWFGTPRNTTHTEKGGDYDWSGDKQNLLLNVFYVGYLATQLPGGCVSNKYGGKRLIGAGVFIASLLTVLTPWIANTGYLNLLVSLRLLQGVALGGTYPALHAMIAKWVPPSERTSLISYIHSGACMGTFGSLLVNQNWNQVWKWMHSFYLLGGLGLAWCIFWVLLVSNSPDNHPSISKDERNYIVNAQQETAFNTRFSVVPWYRILTSIRVWAILVAKFSHSWVWFLLVTRLPRYYTHVFDFKYQHNRDMSMMSYVIGAVSLVISGIVADILIRKKRISILRARRFSNIIAMYTCALILILEGYTSSSNVAGSSALMVTCIFFLCFNNPVYVNHLDIGPRYAGVTMAITNVPAILAAYFSPFVCDLLTDQDVSSPREAYRQVFLIAAGVSVVGSTFFNTFSSGKVQGWNQLQENTKAIHGYSNYVDESIIDSEEETDVSNTSKDLQLSTSFPSVWI